MIQIEDITTQLKQIIANDLDVNRKIEDIKDDVSLFEEGIGLDSVAVMEFITLIEKRFGFQLAEDELNMEPFRTLQTLAQFIQNKLNQSPASATTTVAEKANAQ